MSKGAYIGVGGTAQKVKKGYFGVDGVARKVKKAYLGVDGVARPCWSGGGKLAYYGTITPLSQARYGLEAIAIGSYALALGGYSSNVVDAFDPALTRSTPTVLSVARDAFGTASVGDYALAMGGRGKSSALNTIDAYDSALTRTTPTTLSQVRQFVSGVSVGNYALAVGGASGTSSSSVYYGNKNVRKYWVFWLKCRYSVGINRDVYTFITSFDCRKQPLFR